MPKSVFTGAHQHLVAVLVEARREAGHTQTELAERIGKYQKFIALIARSQRRVDVIEICALARALGPDPAVKYGELVRRQQPNLEI